MVDKEGQLPTSSEVRGQGISVFDHTIGHFLSSESVLHVGLHCLRKKIKRQEEICLNADC